MVIDKYIGEYIMASNTSYQHKIHGEPIWAMVDLSTFTLLRPIIPNSTRVSSNLKKEPKPLHSVAMLELAKIAILVLGYLSIADAGIRTRIRLEHASNLCPIVR